MDFRRGSLQTITEQMLLHVNNLEWLFRRTNGFLDRLEREGAADPQSMPVLDLTNIETSLTELAKAVALHREIATQKHNQEAA